MSTFPASFLWGAANAAYQVEGAAAEDGRGPSIWDVFSHTPGKITRGDTGDVASDQYHRLESDLDLMAEMGLQIHRLSTSWSRVIPDGTGAINAKGLDYYDRFIDGLLKRHIQPMVTLYHWDLPQALQDRGGLGNRDFAEWFADYASVVNARIGDRVAYWNTLNEPWCVAFIGHRDGIFAPGLKDEALALKVVHHQLLGHARVTERLRAGATSGKIGLALNLVSEVPGSDAPEDVAAARRMDGIANRIFLDPLLRGSYPEDMLRYYAPVSDFGFVQAGDLDAISRPIDFLGVNYYQQHITRADPSDPVHKVLVEIPGHRRTAMNIGFNPDGLRDLLLRLKRAYGDRPIFITENGMAMADYADPEGRVRDQERIDFWSEHLDAVADAMASGVDIRGFIAWSFLDNYEWQVGYSRRYGMIFVDYATQTRIWKESGRWYQGMIARHRAR
jgi:beta-glucosidase